MLKETIKRFLPIFLINWYHFFLAFCGAIFYWFPSKKLIVIGVTGTNGKSTVVELTTKILEESGFKVISLSSIKFKIGEKEWQNDLKMTMPGRLKIQKFLRQGVNSGCEYAVLEVTSEGIEQYRHKFIDFKAAVFTNLSPEHIESHGSFEKYKEAKGELFKATKGIHIINLDDGNVEYFQKFPANEKYGYKLVAGSWQPVVKGSDEPKYKIKATNYKEEENVITFEVQNTRFNLSLLGGFNIYNALAAICVGLSQGISLGKCRSALEKTRGIPGRMEEVVSGPFKVFVDYAFTPNALEKVYQTLTANYKMPNTKLICVLGAAGGGRDKWKRPELGRIAAKNCSQIIVTNEDPYDEDPLQILSMIKSGIINAQFPMDNFYEILDRRKAINKALILAKQNDTIIITGKGCEPWICVADGKKVPWDDRKIIKEEFKKLKSDNSYIHKDS
jgi:UDP-N-acetylmuramoyl-L-alanyl-D-glutamate--2,6-diaminopimelate ligase